MPNSGGKEHFIVHNFGNAYSGQISLANATAFSDNSVYARLGIAGLGRHGTTRIARPARAMGMPFSADSSSAVTRARRRVALLSPCCRAGWSLCWALSRW